MKVRIPGSQSLHGKVKAPGSKAYTHRALLASLLSPGESVITGALQCDDTGRTLRGVQLLGAKTRVDKDRVVTSGVRLPQPSKVPIDCGESGATLRFLTAIAGTASTQVRLTGGPKLATRPLDPLVKALKALGASVLTSSDERGIQVLIKGPLRGGKVSILGNISSQFITGLLFGAPLATRDVTIDVEGTLESRPYVDMTIRVLKEHGISIEQTGERFKIAAGQRYSPAHHQVPGDFSSTAFLIASAGTARGKITILGLGASEREPDSLILKILPEIGLHVMHEGDRLTIENGELDGFQFDASDNPDLVPPLEVLGSVAKGSSEIRGVKRLLYKESDRLHSLPTELTKMGARIHVSEDLVKIRGITELVGSSLYSHADHRVTMACATAALGANGPSIIHDSEAISKSYPEFFNDLTKLGVQLSVE